MGSEKQLVLEVVDPAEFERVAADAKRIGIRTLLFRSEPPERFATEFDALVVSEVPGVNTAALVEIAGPEDIQRAVSVSALGHRLVIVDCKDWRVIPLENLLAEFERRKKLLYAYVDDASGAELALSVLQRGVHGVVIPSRALGVAGEVAEKMRPTSPVRLMAGKVTRILDAGVGDRGCVDTTSQLELGEGILVGSRADFFFLVHGETIPTKYIPTRPFRVNAGAIHSYTLVEAEKTRYISELESPNRVLIVDADGNSRRAVIGRVKIERRPLVMVEAAVGDKKGNVILQKAETIRLVRPDGAPVPVTDLRVGEELLVYVSAGKGRHIGGEVDEFIVEK